MDREKIYRAEDMNQAQLAEYTVDLLHRMMVHHTLWGREVEDE